MKLPSLALSLIAILVAQNISLSQMQTIKPKAINDVLINPGIGFTTFHRFNSDHQNGDWPPEQMSEWLLTNGDLKYRVYPPSSIAYFRWYWDEIEPAQGEYNFDLIDETIRLAHENHQKLAFRIMPQNGVPKAPEWYRKIAPGFTFNDGKSWMPDYDDPLYHKHYGNLIAALGKRYDGHPVIDHIDIGAIGRWGEWHTSQTGHEMPTMKTQIQFVDRYLAAFPNTPLTMLIGGSDALKHAIEHGTGWRADCLGDMGGFSKTWNHMEDMYPLALGEANAYDAWKTAPVAFESCWTMKHWVEEGWDVKAILDRALEYHISVFNNKSDTVPRDYWDEVNDFLRRMGYRYVLRRLRVPYSLQPGETASLEALWENTGVAPCYLSYNLVYQLKQGEKVFPFESKANLRTWLPGYHLMKDEFEIPNTVPAGNYQLRVAVFDPQDGEIPAIQLAIEGREADGWYLLCEVEVK